LPGNALTVDDMLVTILPGESTRFRVSRRDGLALDGDINLDDSLGWPVLRCIGDSVPAPLLP